MTALIPVRRDLHFPLDAASVSSWHAEGAEATHLLNAFSVFLPVGERFFIHSLRHYRARISDPDLQQAVTAFIGQEALHGREHESYNRALTEAGYPVEKFERRVDALLDFIKRRLPAAAQLSATIALEHFTAMLADLQIHEPRLTAGAGPSLAALWRWHALEETEHKAVAFDVYTTVFGRGVGAYVLRVGGLVVATAILIPMLLHFQASFARLDPATGGRRQRLKLIDFLLGSPGIFRRMAKPWLDYFRPHFHPWQHDNRQALAGIDAFVVQARALKPDAA